MSPEHNKHNWEKQNWFTEKNKHGSHDILKCSRCGITAKRYGIEWPPTIDYKYRAKKYIVCLGTESERSEEP